MKKYLLLYVIVVLVVATVSAVGLTACNSHVTVKQIEVAEMPTKSSYYVGDSLDVTGCTLNVIYADNSVRNVQVTPDMVSGLDTTSIGSKTVLITYTENNVRYTTTMVLRVVTRPVSELRILTMPAKTEYVEGQSIDLRGLTVEAYYTEQQRVTLGLHDLSYIATTAQVGMTAVRVGFANHTVDVPITVHPVQAVGLEAEAEDEIYRNQTLSIAMFSVWLIYNNDVREQLANATLLEENTSFSSLGSETVHVSYTHPTYGTFTCTTTVEVLPDTVREVTLAEAPLQYDEGAAFLWRDIYLDVVFAHATVRGYHMGVDTYAGLRLDVADGTVLSGGAQVVTVYCGDEAMMSFRVGVGEVVPVRWHVYEDGGVVVCGVGEVPTPQQLQLYAVMSDGREVHVWRRFAAAPGADVTLPAPAVSGQTQATLTYMGLDYTYDILVEQPTAE